MSPLDEFEIDRPEPEDQEPGPHRPGWLIPAVVVLVVLAVAAGAWLAVRRHAAPAPAPSVPARQQAPVAQPRARVELGPPVEPMNLPPLDLTDPVVRELLRQLSSRPELAAWLASDNLVRNLVASIQNVAAGHTPAPHLASVKPRGAFRATANGQALIIDPRSYSRYDGLADTVQSMDPAKLARVYSLLKPRMRDAYRELGHPEGDIDTATERAVARLLQTPVVEGNIDLAQREGVYTFANPALEGLSGAQKQLLRMGPRNVRIVKTQLRALAKALGIPEDQLPAAE